MRPHGGIQKSFRTIIIVQYHPRTEILRFGGAQGRISLVVTEAGGDERERGKRGWGLIMLGKGPKHVHVGIIVAK